MSEKCWRCEGTGKIVAPATAGDGSHYEECPNCFGKGETGKCANCGEDEIEGGRCLYCGEPDP